jgi:cobyrinic acid a,c-diamide synthase
MVLGRGLVDADGTRHAMADLLPVETSFAQRRLHLGYRVAQLHRDGPLGTAGTRYRGHEFHYASILDEQAETPLFAAENARGEDLGGAGASAGSVCGSFIHLIDRATA